MKYTNYIISIIFILISGCSSQNCDMKLVEMDRNIQSKLINEFNAQDIYFERVDEATLCVSTQDLQQVQISMHNVISSLIPKGRSKSFDKQVMGKVTAILNKKNIPYKTYMLDGSTYLVWEKQDSNVVNSIIDSEFDKFLSSQLPEQ